MNIAPLKYQPARHCYPQVYHQHEGIFLIECNHPIARCWFPSRCIASHQRKPHRYHAQCYPVLHLHSLGWLAFPEHGLQKQIPERSTEHALHPRHARHPSHAETHRANQADYRKDKQRPALDISPCQKPHRCILASRRAALPAATAAESQPEYIYQYPLF